jgi:hypothetical protein
MGARGMRPTEMFVDEGHQMIYGDDFVAPLLVPVELRGRELAAVLDPYNLAEGDLLASGPEIVTYDEHALRGLWIERLTGCRFLVTELKSEFFYACGYREFRDERGVFEPWSCNVGNLSFAYDRADGRVPDRESYEGRFFALRDLS